MSDVSHTHAAEEHKKSGGGMSPVAGVIIFMVVVFSGVLILLFEQIDYGLGIFQKRTGQFLILLGMFYGISAILDRKKGH